MSQIDMTTGTVWCEGCDEHVPTAKFHSEHKATCPKKGMLVENRDHYLQPRTARPGPSARDVWVRVAKLRDAVYRRRAGTPDRRVASAYTTVIGWMEELLPSKEERRTLS